MASAAELVWQWSYLMAILLIVLLLLCCFGGCWASFSSNVRGFCADGVNCGFQPFRKKRKKVAVVTVDGKTRTTTIPEGAVMVRTADGETVVAGDKDIDPWGTVFGSCVHLVTCYFCCGALRPDGEGDEEEEAMLPKTVAQPVTVVAPAPLLAMGGTKATKKPGKPVVKAEQVVEPAERLAPAKPVMDRVEPSSAAPARAPERPAASAPAPRQAPRIVPSSPPRENLAEWFPRLPNLREEEANTEARARAVSAPAVGGRMPLLHFYTLP